MFASGIVDLMLDPVVQAGMVAVCGGFALRWFLRGHPADALPLRLAFLIAITAIAVRSGSAPYEPAPTDAPMLHRAFIGATKLVWWTSAAWFMAACVRVFLRFEGQAREARVIQDLVVGVIYVGAVLSIVAYVFGAPVGTLLATSGVVAIILGLALQSTLNDLFSGIALNLGRPYAIGDWIALPDGTQGRVVEMNWRATHLLNGTNDLVILPNAQLAKLMVTNRSNPDLSHGATLALQFAPTRRPSSIVDTVQNALLSATTILQIPAPSIRVTALDADAATLELSFRVADFTQIGLAKSELLDLVFVHAKAADLRLASQREYHGLVPDALQAARPTPNRLIEAMPLFASLTAEERDLIAESMTRHAHRRDEILASSGDILPALLIVRRGVISVEDGSGAKLRLAPGDYFGEAGMLAHSPETSTFCCLTPVIVYRINRDSLTHLIEDRPAIADELAQHLAERQAKIGSSKSFEPVTRSQDPGIFAHVLEQIRAAVSRT